MKQSFAWKSFDLVKRFDDYVIYRGDSPLLTTGGHEVAHPNGRLLKHLLTDLLLASPDDPVVSLQLLEIQRDILEQGDDPVERKMNGIIASDPFMVVKTGGGGPKKSGAKPLGEEELSLSFWVFSELLANVNAFFEERIKQDDLTEEAETPFADVIRKAYAGCTAEQKSAVLYLFGEHDPGLVLPLFLVMNRISPAEYAKGMIALTGGHPKDHSFASIQNESAAIRDYIHAAESAPNPSEELEKMIRRGESNQLEFKSTLRWDLRQGKTAQYIERAVLKTISAFLNSDGGSLVIGVRDDGSVEGIESDRLQTDDRWLLHFWMLIRTCFGRDVTPYIQTRLEQLDGKTVCLIECSKSLHPVFLRQPNFDEEFYIRIGPASNAMTVSEALNYIRDHFTEA